MNQGLKSAGKLKLDIFEGIVVLVPINDLVKRKIFTKGLYEGKVDASPYFKAIITSGRYWNINGDTLQFYCVEIFHFVEIQSTYYLYLQIGLEFSNRILPIYLKIQ